MVKKYHFCLLSKIIRYTSVITSVLVFFSFSNVYAHGLNVRYELPIPLSLYLASASIIVALTLLLLRYFRSFSPVNESRKITENRYLGKKRAYINKIPFLILLFLILSGLIGSQGPLDNIINVFIWVWVWVGIAYISIIFGNVWGGVSPWFNIYSLLLFHFRKNFKKYRRHSDKEAEIIGLVLLFTILWIAIIFPGREVPYNLSFFLIFYSIITLFGMAIYGRSRWNNSAEIFNLYFGMLGRLGILGRDKKNFIDNFRMPLSGVHIGKGSTYSSIFIIIAVASISFDGVLETESWDQLRAYIVSVSFFRPILKALVSLFGEITLVLNTIGFICMPLIIGFFYLLTCASAVRYGGKKINFHSMIVAFAPALIPIAAAYHVAHYFSFLLIAGQVGIQLLSDPFGWGWNIFGTSAMQINVSIINAKIGWVIILISVVLGHVSSIFISHRISFKILKNNSEALKMHLPFSILMVLYTIFSLWILAQPIVQ